MSESAWSSLGIRPVVNAAGKMTYLGSSALAPEVCAAMTDAAKNYVDIAALKDSVGRRIASLTGAPAARVTSCAAAGMTQAVAGAITGTDMGLVETIPDPPISRREVVIQRGHVVHFGAPILQMLRMGGALVKEIGAVSSTRPYHLESALSADTAAVIHVISHHAGGIDQLDLSTVVRIARTAGVPVIVDAAAETDLSRYAQADAAIYSGHKAIGGPTSGVVLGTPELIAAVAVQEAGIGRAMKIGKEGLVGLSVAIERYVEGLGTRSEAELHGLLQSIIDRVDGTIPARLQIVQDPTRPIPRLRVTPEDSAPVDAKELVRRLEAYEPSIRTRNHHAGAGSIDIDPRELSTMDSVRIAEALPAAFGSRGP